MSKHTTEKWEKGDHFAFLGGDCHESGIHIGEWHQRVQCFGTTKKDAEALRDYILLAVQQLDDLLDRERRVKDVFYGGQYFTPFEAIDAIQRIVIDEPAAKAKEGAA